MWPIDRYGLRPVERANRATVCEIPASARVNDTHTDVDVGLLYLSFGYHMLLVDVFICGFLFICVWRQQLYPIKICAVEHCMLRLFIMKDQEWVCNASRAEVPQPVPQPLPNRINTKSPTEYTQLVTQGSSRIAQI